MSENEEPVDEEELTDQDFELFQKASDRFKQNKATYPVTVRNELEALLVQITKGDCTESKPSVFKRDELKKWKAWKKLEGLSMNEGIKMFMLKLVEAEKEALSKSRKSGHYL